MAVVFCHLSLHLQGIFDLSDVSRQFFGNGWVAVQLFFVLSGYNMAHNYPKGVAGGYGKFLVKRLARIYPLHLLMLLDGSGAAARTPSTKERVNKPPTQR
jgi:peptidoglycan/LPS O-acetylase OafA/YrhL